VVAPRCAEDRESGSERRPFVLVTLNRVFLDLALVNDRYVVARVCDISVGSTIMSVAVYEVPYHCEEDDAGRDDRRVVHRVGRHGQNRRQRKDDRDEEGPRDAADVDRPAEPAIAEVERARVELYLGVVRVRAAERDGDDVRYVERHRGEREDRVGRDGRRKVQQARENAEDRREPDGAQWCLGPFGDVAKVAVVRETLVTAEGIDGPGARLESSLADEERCEANE